MMPPPNRREKKTPVATPASSPSASSSKTKKDKERDKEPPKMKFTPVKCKQCQKECLDPAFFNSDDDDSINCDVCKQWFHKTCTNTTSSEWEALKGSNENITFQCDECLQNKGRNSNQLQMFQQILQDNNDILLKRLESLEVNILQKVDEKIDRKLQEFENKNEKLMDDKIKAHLNSETQTKKDQLEIENTIKTQVNQTLDELKDRDERKNNIMIFNIKESAKTEITEELKEDLHSVIQIIKHTNPELNDSLTNQLSENNIQRLGKKKPTTTDDISTKPRPIKLTLPNEASKFKILKKSYKLKSYQENNKVGLKLDLTKQQQIEERELRQELIRRREQKEDVMIFRGKVIKRSEHETLKKEHSSGTNASDSSTQC